jgi:hypothetical protein
MKRATMKNPARVIVSTLILSVGSHSSDAAPAAGASFTFPQKRAATYDEVRRHQALGRFVVAPDGSFFLYEWSRPYDWVPNLSDMAPVVRARMQTFLYRVTTPQEWRTYQPPVSTDLFPPAPGATYFLGNLSPGGKWASFYELDWDDGKIRAGVVETTQVVPPKITWLELPPDEGRLDQPAVWVSDAELVYPLKSELAKLARAQAMTGKAEVCRDCDPRLLARPATDALAGTPATVREENANAVSAIPAGSKQITQSMDRSLVVYMVDTPEVLKLLFTKNGRLVTLFENYRAAQSPPPTK